MASTTESKNILRHSRTAGGLYLLIIMSSLLSLVFLGGKFTVMGDSAASVTKMLQFGTLVRINAVYEVFMFSAVIVLATLLFQITREVNVIVARSALFLRVAEAILGYIGIVLTLGVLVAANGKTGSESTASLAVMLYDLRDLVYKIIMVCISLGTVLFLALFYTARLIPVLLSLWGITGFTLMIVASVFQILSAPGGVTINGIAAALAISFELAIGVWLIVRNVRLPEVRIPATKENNR